MNHRRWAVRTIPLGAVLGLGLVLSGPGRSQPPPDEAPPMEEKEGNPFHQAIAEKAKVNAETVEAVLEALGPAVRDRLAGGEQVPLPGLGTFRVVRIPAHRDLVDGRPTEIPAENYVEFLAEADLVAASNAPGAIPATTVPKFEYVPIPGRTPSNRVPSRRTPSIRIR